MGEFSQSAPTARPLDTTIVSHPSVMGTQGSVLHLPQPPPSDGRGRNSDAGGVSDQAGKRTKEARGVWRGWPGGWQDQRNRFTMEYEAKKGKKVGGSLQGTGLRNFAEAGVERGADMEVAKAPEGPSVSFERI